MSIPAPTILDASHDAAPLVPPGRRGAWLACFAVVAGAVVVAATTGSLAIPVARWPALVAALTAHADPLDARDAQVLLSIRLPRIVLGLAAGGGLAAAGAVLQAVFRNPLADPMLIGVSSGAALAVAAAIVAGGAVVATPFALPLAGFGGGLAATWLLYRIATVDGATSLATMLLAGIAINALAFAGIGGLSTIATNAELRSIAFWNFGSLGGAGWDRVAIVAIAVVASVVALTRLAPGLNALALGEFEARHLGFETQRLKRAVIAWSALVAGFVVAVCGVIGFVALVAPHVARLLFGPDHRAVVPASATIGAALLVVADVVGRTVAAPAELPIGIVTALVGAPFFLWLLTRRRNRLASQ